MFKGIVFSTCATISLLFLTMLCKDEYCCWKLKFPTHLPSQNQIYLPLFKWNESYLRILGLAFIRLTQNCEPPGFF
jgi:hypothetical protein